MAEILNSYENTEELKKVFPVINVTPVETEVEKKIQNRLLSGFANWNRGTDAWMEWGKILYTPDSLYNVHGVHMTLREYQMSSNLAFKKSEMMMGNFNNMVICGDWAAIRYDIMSMDRETGKTYPGSVMEFVKFQDAAPTGTTVVEGWAGTKGADYHGLMSFLTEEERVAQDAAMRKIEDMELPDTDNLQIKYPVAHPTVANSEMADEIRQALLRDFEEWNRGYAHWELWAGQFYDSRLVYHTDAADMDLEAYKALVREKERNTRTTRLYFENMLISGDWAAIHYREVSRDVFSGDKEASGRMQFLHFRKTESGVMVIECWVK